jgi:hypothetical protein
MPDPLLAETSEPPVISKVPTSTGTSGKTDRSAGNTGEDEMNKTRNKTTTN